MKYIKCCVPGCKSLRQDTLLHKLPKCEKGLKKWLECIGSRSLESMRPADLDKQLVCHKHFEARFKTEKNRLKTSAYPSLFSPEEISSGEPTSAKIENVDPKLDHNYAKKTSSMDHSYAVPAFRNVSKRKREVDSKTITCKKDKEDHSIPDLAKAAVFLLNPSNEDNSIEIQSQNYETIVDDNFYTMDQNNVADDFDDAIVLSEDKTNKLDEDVEFVVELSCRKDPDTLMHSDFKCNVCCGDIIGFRYTCLQCEDWDMCAACEARGEHPEHYVLRLPAPRPNAECEPIIAALRQQIENLLLLSKEITSEIYFKEEPDVDGISEVFDPYLTDPFSATSDRNVPELDMHCLQRATRVTITDAAQERPTYASACRVDEPSSLAPGTQRVLKPSSMSDTPGKRIYIKSISSATDAVKQYQRSDKSKKRIILKSTNR